jgi:hypothetical protein
VVLERGSAVDLKRALPQLRRLAAELFADRQLPEVALVRQRIQAPVLAEVELEVQAQVREVVRRSGRKPQPVAVGVGSRGIANLDRIVRAVVIALKEERFEPFIVPAMGSHGASTAEGQARVLAAYGIDEQRMEAPVRATMDVRRIGEFDGVPVHMDRFAVEAGAVFLVARVKPHTDFRGPIESGLAKMCAIGLGKQVGARVMHSYGVHGLRHHLARAARVAAETGLLLGGLGIVENARDETALVRGFTAHEIGGPEEARLLEAARSMMPRIPFAELDVLIVEHMGKDVSGTGMDSNVLNRMRVPGEPEPDGLRIGAVAVLDLTDASHGNAIGIGLADFVTARLIDKVDLGAVYANALTAGLVGIERGQLPIVLPSDRDVVLAAISSCGRPSHVTPRLAWIEDTLHTEVMAVSEPLLEEVRRTPEMEVVSPLRPMPVAPDGDLRRLRALPVPA